MSRIFLVCFILLSFSAYSQRIQLALNGGAIINTNPSGLSFITNKKFGNLNWYSNAKGLLVIKKWQFGLGLEAMSLKGTKVKMANPALVPEGIVNYKIGIGDNNYIYLGLCGGYMFAQKGKQKDANVDGGNIYLNNGSGFVYGSQAGITHSFGQKISLNMELGMRNANINTDVDYVKYSYVNGTTSHILVSNNVHQDVYYSVLYFPLTIGLRYKL